MRIMRHLGCSLALVVVVFAAALALAPVSAGATLTPSTPPIANDDAYTTSSDASAVPLAVAAPGVLANDGGVPLTAILVSGPSHAAPSGFSLNGDGSFRYTPATSYAGSDSFTYKANNGRADSNTATVTIAVAHTNRPPVASDASLVTNVNTAANITLSATDPDNDALTYTIVATPAHGALSGTAPNLTYTPNNNYSGSDSFTFKANDGHVDSNIATISITVNHPPVANNGSVTAHGTTALAITLTATDADNDPLTYTIVSGPAHGSLSGTAPNVTYTANAGYAGSDSFTFKANDGHADSNVATVAITVVPPPPTAVNDTYRVTGNISISVPSNAGVTNNDTLNNGATLTGFGNSTTNANGTAPGGTVTTTNGGTVALQASGDFTYNPPANFTGTDTFYYTLTNAGGTATGKVTLTVSDRVIFVNNTGANGTGRPDAPFKTLAAAQAVPAVTTGKDLIYVSQGSGSYTDSITLKTNQSLVGQGISLSSALSLPTINLTLAQYSVTANFPAADGKPTVGNTVMVASGVTVDALDINAGTNAGLTGSGGLTSVTVGHAGGTGNDNVTVTTTTGTGVSLANVGGTFTFKSISANGATNGIALANTTGSFTVTGDGTSSNNGSGGTIQNATGPGILLSTTGAISLTGMTVQNGVDDGIRGANVSGFALAYSTVSGNGNAVGERGLDFGDVTTATNGITGTATITSTTVTNSRYDDNVMISDSSGTLSLTVTGSTFSNSLHINGATSDGGNDGLLVLAYNTASITANVSGSTFSTNRGDHFQFTTNTTATGTNNVTFRNNTLTGDRGTTFGGYTLGGGITVNPGGSGTTTLTVSNNTITGAVDSAIRLNPGLAAGGVLNATVSNNTIGDPAVTDSGSSQANGIFIQTTGSGTTNALVSDNKVRQYANCCGIYLLAGEGSSQQNATVIGNTVSNPDATNALNGIRIAAGTLSGDTVVLCADVGGTGAAANSATGSGGTGQTDLRARLGVSNATIKLPGYTGGASDAAAISSYLSGRNGGASASASVGNGNFQNGGSACTRP